MMTRTIFSTLGVAFAALLLFCTSFLGNIAADLERHRTASEAEAVQLTRELSRSWNPRALAPVFSADADEVLLPLLDAEAAGWRRLGPLLHASDVRTQARWSRGLGRMSLAPADLAHRLADFLGGAITVTFTGRFAGGTAEVSAVLRHEGHRRKLWRLRIESREPPVPEPRPERRVISHA